MDQSNPSYRPGRLRRSWPRETELLHSFPVVTIPTTRRQVPTGRPWTGALPLKNQGMSMRWPLKGLNQTPPCHVCPQMSQWRLWVWTEPAIG